MLWRHVVFFWLCAALAADTVVLHNGQRFEGELERVDEREVVLLIGGGRMRFRRSQVAEILRDDEADGEATPAAPGALPVDPHALLAEASWFAEQRFSLPRARVFIGEEHPELEGLLPLSVECLGARFATRPGDGVVLVAVEASSRAARTLREKPRRADVELAVYAEPRSRAPGGVPQRYTLLRVEAAQVVEEPDWGQLHSDFARYAGQQPRGAERSQAQRDLPRLLPAGQRFTTFLRFAEEPLRAPLGDYTLVAAESEPGFAVGNLERPGGWLTPALRGRAPELPGGPLAPFCRVTFRIDELTVDDPYRGEVSAGLARIESVEPLRGAEHFGAPALLTGTTGGAALDGARLTDPVALAAAPERFAGATVRIPGRVWLGDPFARDRAVRGLRVVELSSLAAPFGRDAQRGEVVLAVEEGSAAARTIARLDHQAAVILTVEVEARRRAVGGVLEVAYSLGRVVGVERWTDADWHVLSGRWREHLGERFWVLLRPEGLLAPGLTVEEDGARPLRASHTDQHETPTRHLRGRLVPVLPQDPASAERLGAHLAEASGFCRVQVELGTGTLTNDARDNVGVARVLAIEPLATRAGAAEGAGRDPVALHALVPDADDLAEWFDDRREELRRGLYQDLRDDERRAEGAYRLVDAEGRARLVAHAPAQAAQLWERGTRKVTVSHSMSYFSGPNTVTTLDFGTSTTSRATWHRLYRRGGSWQRPELAATLARFDALAAAAEELRPARNAAVRAIIEVEERGGLRFLREDVARRADQVALWERDPSRANPGARERLDELRRELAERQAALAALEDGYAAALASVAEVGVAYRELLREASAFASGERAPLGYE